MGSSKETVCEWVVNSLLICRVTHSESFVQMSKPVTAGHRMKDVLQVFEPKAIKVINLN